MLVLLSVVAVLSAPDSALADPEQVAAEAIPYRVSGIFSSSDGASLAIVEMPYGKSGIYGAGDAIDEAEVLAVAPDGLTLEYQGQRYFLRLKGDASLMLAAIETRTDGPPPVGHTQQPLDFGSTLTALDGVVPPGARRPVADGSAQAGQSSGSGASNRQLSVNEILKLAENDNIVAVNHESVHSPEAALAALKPKLRDGSLYKLVVANPDGGMKMIYVDQVDVPAEPRE